MPVGGAGATVTVTGAKADFIERMKVAAKITGQIARVVPTTRKSETFPILGQVAQLVQWTDERADDDVYETSVPITPKHWGAGLPIHRDTYDDDQVGGYAELIRGLSQRAADFPTKRLLKDVIDAAYSNSTFGNAYDGQSFFDTDHADPGPATYTTSQDNDLTGTAATSTTPTVAEGHTALDAIEERQQTRGKGVTTGVAAIDDEVTWNKDLDRWVRGVTLAGPDWSPTWTIPSGTDGAYAGPLQAVLIDGVLGVYTKTVELDRDSNWNP